MPETLTTEDLGGANSAGPETDPNKSTAPEYVSKADFQTGLKDLGKQIMDSVSAGLKANRQSQSDVIRNQVGKQSATVEGNLVERMAALLPEGTDLNALKRDAFVDSAMAGNLGLANGQPDPKEEGSPSTSGGSLVKSEIAAILKEHKVSADHPELLEYVKANEGEPWYQEGQGFDDLVRMIASREQGDGTTIISPSGGPQPRPDLELAYRKEAGAVTSIPGLTYAQRMTELRKVQDAFQKRGLNVKSIDLTNASKNRNAEGEVISPSVF